MSTKFYPRRQIEQISGTRITRRQVYLPTGRTLNGVEIDLSLYSDLCRREAQKPYGAPEIDLAPCVTVVLDDGSRFKGVSSSGSDLSWGQGSNYSSVPIGHYLIIKLALEGRQL